MSAIPTPPPAAPPPSDAPNPPPSEGLSADSERTVADAEYDEKKPRSSSDSGGGEGGEPALPSQAPRDTGAAAAANACGSGSEPSPTATHTNDGNVHDSEKKKGGFWKKKKDTEKGEKRKEGGDAEAQRAPDIYDRFPPRKKKLIVAIVAYSAFLGRKFTSLCSRCSLAR